MAAKLFVGGLSWDTTNDSLSNFFAQVGMVVSASVVTDKFTGKSRGFGFVEMSSEQEARDAVEKLNGQNLDGRNVAVNEARPQAPRDNSSYSRPQGGGGYGGGGGYSGGGGNGGRDRRGGGRGGFRDSRDRRSY